MHDSGVGLRGEDITSIVKAKMPRVNKSTIYRTLGLLERLGCIYKSESVDGFVYHLAEEKHRYHIGCYVCGKTADCDEDLFHPLEIALNDGHDFQVSLGHVVMPGLCRDCRSSNRT
jgi:Fur family ferric uptake transcriptional regulator